MHASIQNLPTCWHPLFTRECTKAYFLHIMEQLEQSDEKNNQIYPHLNDLFRAFSITPYSKVRVVILGQDPYHGPGQAHGLSFSVPKGIKAPPSLRNIHKALAHDLCIPPTSFFTDLTPWAKQGVFLLNTILSVQQGLAGSHHTLGWQTFTTEVLKALANKPTPIIFMLWGKHAQKIRPLIHHPLHAVLEAPHPSPLSAHRGFITCKHFSKANDWLKQHQSIPIVWGIQENLQCASEIASIETS